MLLRNVSNSSYRVQPGTHFWNLLLIASRICVLTCWVTCFINAFWHHSWTDITALIFLKSRERWKSYTLSLVGAKGRKGSTEDSDGTRSEKLLNELTVSSLLQTELRAVRARTLSFTFRVAWPCFLSWIIPSEWTFFSTSILADIVCWFRGSFGLPGSVSNLSADSGCLWVRSGTANDPGWDDGMSLSKTCSQQEKKKKSSGEICYSYHNSSLPL